MSLKPRHLPLVALALAAHAIGARAQSFNIDIGDQPPTSPIPAQVYPAGAVQTGFWNSVLPTVTLPAALNDLNGVLTGVSLGRQGGLGVFNFNHPLTLGDDEALMDDTQMIGSVGNSTIWTFAGLASGSYRLYTYAWVPNDPNARTIVTSSAGGSPQLCGGAWPGQQTEGVTYVVNQFQVFAGSQIQITITTNVGEGMVNGFQLVGMPPPGQSLCFGDGSGTPCPNGNNSPPGSGAGCNNSLNMAAVLEIVGNPSISADTLTLRGTFMPFGPCLYFQGDALVAGGSGAGFGNGLRCAGGVVRRLKIKFNGHGSSIFPEPGDPPVSTQGLVSTPGFRYYQVWYRDAAASPFTHNLSQTVCIPWVP